ncbi:uncharacterized protein [Amphiura filiformis]|uniref:uncharacterized protein n=1 Tax=Amphiura filiformis TaxID=82378 RepID=UPI003B228854
MLCYAFTVSRTISTGGTFIHTAVHVLNSLPDGVVGDVSDNSAPSSKKLQEQRNSCPPDFPTFVEGWQYTANHVKKEKGFLVTQLHRNLNPQGKFKFVNHAIFDGPDFAAFRGPYNPEFKEVTLKGHGPPGHQKKFPGGYEEFATSTGKPLVPWLQRDDNSLWILTAFHVNKEKAAAVADFEKNWRAQSGADFILNAPKEIGITKVGFYKKFVSPPVLNSYDYFLRAEITGIANDNNAPALDFLKKLVEFKYPGLRVTDTDTALYKTDPEYIIYPDAGRRDLPEGHSWVLE